MIRVILSKKKQSKTKKQNKQRHEPFLTDCSGTQDAVCPMKTCLKALRNTSLII